MSTPTRALACVAAILAAGLAPAAGSGAAAAGATSPCTLVTAAQVKAAFGGTVAAGEIDNSIPGQATCHFAVKGSNLGANGDTIVFLTPNQTPALFALAKREVPGAVTVPGLGDGAFYNAHTTAIELIVGGTVADAQAVFFTAQGTHVTSGKVKADVIALARAVAKHL